VHQRSFPRKPTQDHDSPANQCRNLVPYASVMSVCQQCCDTPHTHRETAGSVVCYLILHPRHRQSGYGQNLSSARASEAAPIKLSISKETILLNGCLSHAIQIQRQDACLKHSRLFKVNKGMWWVRPSSLVKRSLKGLCEAL